MSEQINDGGPAFPRPPFTPKERHDQFAQAGFAATGHPGMSLRDWFAGQALAGIITSDQKSEMRLADVVESAFEIADAMLERRKK